MFDYFVAPLRCPQCSTASPADSSTNMQTHIRDDADGSELGVGARLDPLDVRVEDILNSGYQLVRRPDPGGRVVLLETWQCEACGRGDNWARIAISDGLVQSIEAVRLDREVLENANFISDQCEVLAAQLSGLPATEFATGAADCVEVLRQRL